MLSNIHSSLAPLCLPGWDQRGPMEQVLEQQCNALHVSLAETVRSDVIPLS